MGARPIPKPVQESDEDLLFLMANLSPRLTGLPFAVWISPRGNAQHAVRVKVSLRPKMVPSEMASVTVEAPIQEIGNERQLSGEQLKLLRRWIELNREIIVKFWNGEIEYSDEAIAALQPIQD
jgi:hypothetical protein